jgi:IclR family acetate operon transcriptional repressor
MTTVKENQSVRNACIVIEAIARAQPIGVSDLSRRTGIDKSAVHRLAVSLHRAGWLHQATDGRWRIAPALAALVTPASTDSLVEIVRPVLEQLRNQTGETVMLVVIERAKLMVLDVADSPQALRITARIGAELPLRSSSALRAIAARLPAHEIDKLREIDPGLDDQTLGETRSRGWALNDREITPDTRVAGAAILSPEGRPLGALIACAPTTRVDIDAMHAIGGLVAQAAEQVSLNVGMTLATHATNAAEPSRRIRTSAGSVTR